MSCTTPKLGAQFAPTFHRPFLRYLDGDAGAAGGTPPAPAPPAPTEKSDADFLAEFGFPQKTAVADMTVEQREKYWHNQSKTQQKDADAFKKLGKTPAEIQQILADAEAARVAALSETEQKIEAAKREGAATASLKFLAPAIEGQVVALTRGANETLDDATKRVKGALKFIDETKFLDGNGDLDAAEIQTFAQSLVPTAGNGSTSGGDPLLNALQRQQPTPPGSGGSVKAMEDAAYAAMSARKNPQK